MARSNGRPEPEVIVNFADGMGYSKGKMEEAFRQGGLLDKPVIKGNKEIAHAKREDVDLIVHELELPRAQCEQALAAASGDIERHWATDYLFSLYEST